MTAPSTDGSMMDIATAASAEVHEPDAATYNAFVEGLELTEIELVKVDGERVAAGVATQTRFDLTAGYLQDGTAICYRYDVIAHLTNDPGTELGHAAVTVVLTTRSTAVAEAACIERFGGTSGALIVHPYLREAIASIAQRLGFPGVLLPMIKHQPDEPAVSLKEAVEVPNADTDAQVDTT
jgi:hypothetical protein